MRWNEGGLAFIQIAGVDAQMDDVVEGADPTTHIRVCGGDELSVDDNEGPGIVSGGVRRVRKGLHPRFDGEFWAAELDMSEDVPSGPLNP